MKSEAEDLLMLCFQKKVNENNPVIRMKKPDRFSKTVRFQVKKITNNLIKIVGYLKS